MGEFHGEKPCQEDFKDLLYAFWEFKMSKKDANLFLKDSSKILNKWSNRSGSFFIGSNCVDFEEVRNECTDRKRAMWECPKWNKYIEAFHPDHDTYKWKPPSVSRKDFDKIK